MALVNAETGEIVSRERADGWLASVDAATYALAQVERVDEAAQLMDAAETAKVYRPQRPALARGAEPRRPCLAAVPAPGLRVACGGTETGGQSLRG